jgi:sugar/nucleoside kinase (ribokinase family)
MFDLISVGSIAVDLYFRGHSLTFKDNRFQLAVGGKYIADYFHESVGGGGANIAIGAVRHGLKTAVMGKIGLNPFKENILKKLKEENVSTGLCQFEDKYLNLSAIFLTPKGERTIVHYATPHQQLLNEKGGERKLLNGKVVYFGNLSDVSLTQRTEALRFIKKHDVMTVVNLGVQDCRKKKDQLEEFLKQIDVLILNGYEFADLVKASYKDIHFKEDVVKWYVPILKDKVVVVTEGTKGSYAYHRGNVYHQGAVETDKVLDTTGAGDAYTAGFISGFFKSGKIDEAMLKGAKYATRILEKIGAN